MFILSLGFAAENNSRQSSWVEDVLKEMNIQIDKYALPGGIVGFSIKDLSTNEQFSSNGNQIFNPASVIKVPVMVEAFHQAAQGKLSLDEDLTLHQENKIPGSGSLQWSHAGNVFSIKRLIYLMITDSDNTATNMLIHRLGMGNINAYMHHIGLRHTVIKDPTLLVKKPGHFNLSTPNDMLSLLEKMYKGLLVNPDSSAAMLAIMKEQKHKWGISRFLPVSVVVANKTGSLDYVRNDIGIIYDGDKPYIVSIFSKHLPSNRYGSVMVGALSRVIFERHRQEFSRT